MNDLTGPVVFVNDILKGITHFGEVRRFLCQKMERRLRIRKYRGKWLIDLVGNRTGELAEHGHARQVLQLPTLKGRLSLGLSASSALNEDVADKERLN